MPKRRTKPSHWPPLAPGGHLRAKVRYVELRRVHAIRAIASVSWLVVGVRLAGAQGALVEGDPLGTEATRELSVSVRSERALRFARVPTVRGDGLWAPPWVRERAAVLRVRIGPLEAEGESRSELRSSGAVASEARILLRLPRGAQVTGGRVCVAEGGEAYGCRELQPVPSVNVTPMRWGYEAALRAEPDGASEEGVRPLVVWLSHGARGHAQLWFAPLPPGGTARVTVRWRAPVQALGGEVWLALPARGDDVRLAPERLLLEAARGVESPVASRPAGQEELFPREAVELRARLRLSAPVLTRVEGTWSGSSRCGDWRFRWGVEGRMVADSEPPPPRRVLIVLDASRSMEGTARNRLPAALEALVEAIPPNSSVAWAALGARAEWLQEGWRTLEDTDLAGVLRAWEALPEAPWTRPEALDDVFGGLSPSPTEVVVLGDGGASRSRVDFEALGRAWKRRGGRLVFVSLLEEAPESAWEELARGSGGRVLAPWPWWFGEASSAHRAAWLRGAWARAVRRVSVRWACEPSDGDERLVLWSGESTGVGIGQMQASGASGASMGDASPPPLHWLPAPRGGRLFVPETPMCPARRIRLPRAPGAVCFGRRRFRVPWQRVAMAEWMALGPALRRAAVAHWWRHHPEGGAWPRHLPGGVRKGARPLARAVPRGHRGLLEESPSASPPASMPPRRLPRAALLSMLRRRVIPSARRCLRRERRGRLDHAVRAVLRFAMARRELLFARVEGEVSASLARCLAETLERLDVPRFDGVALVRYPLRTLRVAPRPRLELTSLARKALEDVFEDVSDERVWDLLSLP